jgi:hypothetical protein
MTEVIGGALVIHTAGKLTFAVRENLCRAFFIGRTAKRYFAVRFVRFF